MVVVVVSSRAEYNFTFGWKMFSETPVGCDATRKPWSCKEEGRIGAASQVVLVLVIALVVALRIELRLLLLVPL